MAKTTKNAKRIEAQKELRNQFRNHKDTINRLITLRDSLPEGSDKDRLSGLIGALDLMFDAIRDWLQSPHNWKKRPKHLPENNFPE